MVRCEVFIGQHGGFDGGKAVPRFCLQEVLSLYLVEHADEIDACPVLFLHFVEQIHAWVVGEEPVLAVVKVEVHTACREENHGKNDNRERLLGAVNAPIGEHHERISHDFCTFYLLITVRLASISPAPDWRLCG